MVGSHAHELQGDGRLGPGYVAYGLGNFAWYSPGPTGVLTLTVQPPREPAGRARVTASALVAGDDRRGRARRPGLRSRGSGLPGPPRGAARVRRAGG